MTFTDLTGQKFNKLTVKKLIGKQGKRNLWLLQCECGREVKATSERFKKVGINLCKCRYEEAFFKKVKEVHGDTYSYSKAKYNGSLNDLTITCKIHGDFEQKGSIHAQGGGCPKCAWGSENVVNSDKFVGKKFNKLTVLKPLDQRDEKGSILWECLCDCGNTKLTSLYKLTGGMLKSCGCAKYSGGKRLKVKEFIDRSNEAHNYKYDYSEIGEYKNCTVKVNIICPEHGNFMQRPADHMNGHGCPSCSAGGYSANSTGSIYILYCGDITKVGITNKGVNNRLSELNRRSGFDFEVYREVVFKDGNIPKTIEQELLRYLKSKYKTPKAKFHGKSECFLNVDRKELAALFEKLLEEYNG